MHVERVGTGAQAIMFIHGSMAPGWETWSAQRELASDFTLVVPHRSGYPPNPPCKSTDFDQDAAEIARLMDPGTHVVGHSYGAVVALLAAARAVALPPELVACARATMAERPPWEARVPFATLRKAALPVLAVSGGHSEAFDAV